jgi:hypothetical protein
MTPVKTSTRENPVIISTKWILQGNSVLRKVFHFDDIEKRNLFLTLFFSNEKETLNFSKIYVDADSVEIKICNENENIPISDLNKETAKFADILWKDVHYEL